MTEAEVQAALPSYVQFRALSAGGQGVVFCAKSRHDSEEIAIKIYSPEQQLARARREVDKLREISSPHVLQLIDDGHISIRGRSCLYTVTPFHPGEDLRERLKNFGPMAESDVRKLLSDIARGIDTLWSKNLVHCDIKPSNILVDSQGQYLLLDLGLAKCLDPEATRLTGSGLVLGTMGYLAPEQMRGRQNLSLRVDLFALGIVGYQAITGRHPFGGNQLAIGQFTPPKPSAFSQGISDEIEKVLGALLQPISYRRPNTGQWVIDQLS